MRIAAFLATAVLAAPMGLAQSAAPELDQTVSVQEARAMGLAAIQQGRPDIGLEIATVLVQKDKADSFAHFLNANSLLRLGHFRDAEAAAKQAYHYSETPEQSYQSAHLAAELAFRRGALTTSQWWLRKSAEAAPDAERKDETIAQFQAVRARNPWAVKLAFSMQPSDNVNNGSSGQYNIIDGLPYVGSLSADAQAVKGMVATGAVSLGYRLRQSQSSETTVGADISLRRVNLSAAEKVRLGGDPGFGSSRYSMSLRHEWRVDTNPQQFSVEGELGRQIYQSGDDYSFLGLSFGHRIPIGSTALLDSALDLELRSKQPGQRGDRNFGIRSTVLRQRSNDDIITASVIVNRFDTATDGRSSTLVGAQIGYSL
ncbi:tetratricopeptide repeat protein, partial [Pseudorhodobacter sp.]|uniref:tetratricopeptide repeat protein n=1 Tax=Pseudorhodobacter sp. TaxID=1934400 RepID=UPI0026488BC7